MRSVVAAWLRPAAVFPPRRRCSVAHGRAACVEKPSETVQTSHVRSPFDEEAACTRLSHPN